MTDNQTEQPQAPEKRRLSRRRLIHILAAGGAITSAKLLPDQWTKPAVDSIMLPAHADSSPNGRGPEPFPGNFSEDDVRRFVNDLSPEQLDELKSQLNEEQLKQLEGFME